MTQGRGMGGDRRDGEVESAGRSDRGCDRCLSYLELLWKGGGARIEDSFLVKQAHSDI